MIKFGIIGCGRISKRHTDLLGNGEIRDAELVCVCDIDSKKTEQYAKKYNINAYSDMHEMMKNESIDVVVILTESGNHAKHVCELAKMHVAEGDTVMFVSARNNTERDVTIDQIRNWIGIDNPILFMRGPGDYRPDEIFKRDILEFLRQDDILGQDPDIVYDDRNKVVDMWKANGINCIQVVTRQEGNF